MGPHAKEILDFRPTRTEPSGGPRLLVTAFGRFDGGPNCSEALLERLARDRDEIKALWGGPASFVLLPVRAETAERELAAALALARPSHLLMLGQAAGRDRLSFERVARNRLRLLVPDEAGRFGDYGWVREGGPEERRATWPDLDGVVAALDAEGAPAGLSDDAGSHLCNQSLYLALEAAERAEPGFVATFLHLPLLPEQVEAGVPAAARLPGCAVLPLDEMARAVRLVLVHTRRTMSADPDR